MVALLVANEFIKILKRTECYYIVRVVRQHEPSDSVLLTKIMALHKYQFILFLYALMGIIYTKGMLGACQWAP